MKEQILKILDDKNKALSDKELRAFLGNINEDEYQKALRDLMDIGDLFLTKKNKYMLFSDTNLLKGTLRTNKKGYGFVDIGEDDDVMIPERSIHNALDGDLVAVRIVRKTEKGLEGELVQIFLHANKRVVGEVFIENNNIYVRPNEKNLLMTLLIPKDQSMNVVSGHEVVVEVLGQIGDSLYEGKVITIIGHKDDPQVDILTIAYKYGFSLEKKKEVDEQVKSLPTNVLKEEYLNRKDLRNLKVVTIDGDDTKDIDDAISLEITKNNNYLLGVHIADVTHYYKVGSPLEQDAYLKGTSVYLTDYVLPMLPHELSNGICSLNEGEDRLTISALMEFNREGELINYSVVPSVIRSSKKMTYKKVNDYLDKSVISDGYQDFTEMLKSMYDLSNILGKKMIKRGYIEFNSTEVKIEVDELGKPLNIVKRESGTGEKIIENFMIAANECVANIIYKKNLPFIYRIHEKPDKEDILEFMEYLSSLGYSLKGNFGELKPKDVQNIMQELKGLKEYEILSDKLLRTMKKAIYSVNNVGHFGLGSDCYTHFTAPIRRYPDQIVHRLLKEYLFNHSERSPFPLDISVMAQYVSKKEQDSINCEREVNNMKMAEYMVKYIGQEFEGMISNLTSFGMFVRLDNYVEGLVSIQEMDDYYYFDEKRLSYKGKNKGKIYRLGDRVRVLLTRASKEDRTIDFKLVEKKDEEKI